MTTFAHFARTKLSLWHGRLIGLFVVLQLSFLLAANFLPLLPQRFEEAGELTDDITWSGQAFESELVQVSLETTSSLVRSYGEATGQMQNWSLFAPGIAPQATFPVVELQWQQPSVAAKDQTSPAKVEILSEFAHADRTHYAQFPITNSRLFNYEFRMTHPLWYCTDENLQSMPEIMEHWVSQRTRRQQKSLQAYLLWKTNAYLAEHPADALPEYAVLVVRCFPIAKPGQPETSLPEPQDRPLVRVTLQAMNDGSHHPHCTAAKYEFFNPVKNEFQLVSADTECNHAQ